MVQEIDAGQDVPTNWGTGQPTPIILPISGNSWWGASNHQGFTNNVIIRFTEPIIGGDENERVVQVGVTALSHDYITNPHWLEMRATLSGGEVLTAGADIFAPSGEKDTFFGFAAPPLQYITQLELTATGQGVSQSFRFDDLGFITAVVPEPTALALTAMLCVCGMTRWGPNR